jgi:hypothetical protein
MPFLRQDGDTSIGDTLSNLGRSLGEAFNPLNRMRAYDIQQQIWLRNEQLRQEQRKNAAQLAAVRQYGHLVPPDKLPMIANMIYQNAPYEQINLAAAQASGGMTDDTSDAGTAANIAWYNKVNPHAPWDKPYPPPVGPKTMAAMNDISAQQKGKEAASTTFGTNTAKQAAIDALTQEQTDDPAHDAENRQRAIAIEALGGPKAPDPGFTIPVGPKTRAIYQTEKANAAQADAEAKARGTRSGTGLPADKPVTDVPLPPPTSPILQGPQSAAPPAPAPAPAPPQTPTPVPAPAPVPAQPVSVVRTPVPKGATEDRTRSGWYWQGGQLKPATAISGPPGTVIGGPAPGDLDMAKSASDDAAKTLNGAYADGAAATKLNVIIGQLSGLQKIAQTDGFWGQPTAALNAKLQEYGLGGITSPQQAQQLMDQLIKTELPTLLKQYDVVRVAQPEIKMMQSVTGTAQLASPVMSGILANLKTGADYILHRKDLAARTLGYGDPSDPNQAPMNYPEFQQGDAALLDKYNANAEANRTKFGGLGAAPPGPPVYHLPSDTPTDVTTQAAVDPWTTFWQGVQHVFGGGGGSPTPAPAPPVQTPPPEPTPDGSSRELIPGRDF